VLRRIRTLSLILIVTLVVQCLAAMAAIAAPKGPEVHALGDNGPVLIGMIPSNNAQQVVTNTSLKLTFDETIIRGTGEILLYQKGVATPIAKYDVTNVAMVQLDDSNRSIVIKPTSNLIASTKEYYVIVPDTAIISYASGKYFQGLKQNTDWAFTADQLVPVASNFSPAHGAVAVDPGASGSLSFDFTREVTKGSGYIQIKRTMDNVTVQSIDIASSEVTIAATGANWKVSAPLRGLDYSTSYYVLINSGALKDLDNGAYAGITVPGNVAGGWAFTTKPALDTTKPKAVTFSPANGGSLGDVETNVLTLTFDKTVYANANKSLVIRNAATNALFCTVSADATVTGGNSININLSGSYCPKLANNMDLSITIGSDVYRDASGNYFDGVTWRFKVVEDKTPPVITAYSPAVSSTTVSTSTTQFILTFNKPLAALAANATAQIVPQNNPNSKTNLEMKVDPANNTRVLITASSAKLSGNMNYSILISGGLIKDLAGNFFDGIANPYQWTFQTAANTTPTISSSTIDNSEIILTYSENLDSSKVPYGTNFYVTVNDVARAVTKVTVNNNEVRLTLQSAVLAGQAVKVSYFPDSNDKEKRLKNVGGIEAASFSNRIATNKTDTLIPKPTSGIFSGESLLLIFNRSLTTPTTSGYHSQFIVKQGGVQIPVTSALVAGSIITLSLSNTFKSAQPVSITYTPGSNPLRDQSGNQLTAFTDFYIRNVFDTEAPQLSSATVTGTKLIMNFNEGLDTNNIPSKSSFSITTSGTAATVTAVAVVNNTIELTLSQSVPNNVPVQLFYYPGTPAITDLSGNMAAAISGYNLISGTVGAVAQLSSSTISGNQIVLTYSSTLNVNAIPYTSQYTVKYDGVTIPVSGISISGTQAVLTMSTTVQNGQRVLLTYISTGIPLKDSLSQSVAAFKDTVVTNQTGASGGSGTPVLGNLPDYMESDGVGGLRLIQSKVATPVVISTASKKIANRYMIDGTKLINAYDSIKTITGVKVPMITFKIPSTEAVGMVGIPYSAMLDASNRSSNASFRIEYGDLIFVIPLKAINYSKQLQLSGGDASTTYLFFHIEKTSSTPLLSKLNTKGAQMLAAPVDFTVKLVSGGHEREIDTYDDFVTRTFVLSSTGGATENDIAVVRMDNDSGDVSYVPTKISTTAGATSVSFMRKGNSTYAVVRNKATFTDMTKHWAKDDVTILASKLIVTGPTRTTFAPAKNITRADFAEYIARGLGLTGSNASAAKFKDVGASHRSASYIGAVSDAGIVEGSTDGKFNPTASITREEMATMLVRAMKYAGVSTTAPSTALNGFKDSAKVSNWAKDGVSISVTAGFIKGSTTQTINPKSNATRAEAAIMIKRFLEYVDFL